MSEGRSAMNDAARDGELDLGAVGRTLVRKKWWILGPAIAVAALTFVGVNLDHAEIQVRSAHHHRRARERVPAARGREGRDRTRPHGRPGSDHQPGAACALARCRAAGDQGAQARRAAGIRFRAARRVADPLFARLPRARERSAEHDAGRARAGSLLRAADGVSGRQVARDRDRIPVVRSGVRRARSRTRSRTATSRCSSRRGATRPARPASGSPARSTCCARRWPRPRRRSRNSAPRPISSSAPTTRRCRTRRSANRTATSRRRVRRRPSSRRRRSSSATCSRAAARSNPPTWSIRA